MSGIISPKSVETKLLIYTTTISDSWDIIRKQHHLLLPSKYFIFLPTQVATLYSQVIKSP